MRVFRLTVETDGKGGYVNSDHQEIAVNMEDLLLDSEIGGQFTVFVEDMSEEDYMKLPEFTGF